MDPVLFFIPYVIGTLLGLHWGFKSGVRNGSEATVDALMQKGFLKWKEGRDGNIEFTKVK